METMGTTVSILEMTDFFSVLSDRKWDMLRWTRWASIASTSPWNVWEPQGIVDPYGSPKSNDFEQLL